MARIPRDRLPDSTIALLREGYAFIPRRARRYRSDVFETRLALERTLCLTGVEAAQLFYADERFQRAGAAPGWLTRTLFGTGGVQGLDGEAHRHRKHLFMSLMTPDSIARLVALSADEWRLAIARWERQGRVVLFDEVEQILCRAVCAWAGVPLDESDVAHRTRQLGALIEAPGSMGLRHWQGRLARIRADRWAGDLVRKARAGTIHVEPGDALAVVARHRGLDGQLLREHDAAVELLNLLRPVVAVALYVIFIAMALHTYGGARQKLLSGAYAPEGFVHEVRRFYPFFPFVAARVRHDFEWRGYRFEAGTRTLLDLYGTNHDPRLWEEPGAFKPERFANRDIDAFTLIPQGGGDHDTGHRCAGEWITIELMKEALRVLTEEMRYDVPPQDLRIELSHMPAIPNSRFVIGSVRAGI
jgi:fatty-acid peroxygenase